MKKLLLVIALLLPINVYATPVPWDGDFSLQELKFLTSFGTPDVFFGSATSTAPFSFFGSATGSSNLLVLQPQGISTLTLTASGVATFVSGSTISLDGGTTTINSTELNLLDTMTAKSGADLTFLTGTAGSNGHCAQWNADGDLVTTGASCGGSGLFTDSGDFTYLTSTTDDLVLGGSATSTAPFWFDVSATGSTNLLTLRSQGLDAVSFTASGAATFNDLTIDSGGVLTFPTGGYPILTDGYIAMNAAETAFFDISSGPWDFANPTNQFRFNQGTILDGFGILNFNASSTDLMIDFQVVNKQEVLTVTASSVMNLSQSGGAYQIGGTNVLTSTTLGGAVVSSSLTGVGTLTSGATGAGFTVNLDSSTLTCTGCIQAGDYAAASIDGDDVNSNIAGRSLTLTSASPDTLDADAELYQKDFQATILSPDTNLDHDIQWKATLPWTISRLSCSTDAGTVTIDLEVRDEAAPNTASTSMTSGSLICDTGTEATTTFSNASVYGDTLVSLGITATSSSPTVVRVHLDGSFND